MNLGLMPFVGTSPEIHWKCTTSNTVSDMMFVISALVPESAKQLSE